MEDNALFNIEIARFSQCQLRKEAVYGAVTIGDAWVFGRLDETHRNHF